MDTFRFKLILIVIAFFFPAISYSAFATQNRYSSFREGVRTFFKFSYGGESYSIEGTAPPDSSDTFKINEKVSARNMPGGGAAYTSNQKFTVGSDGIAHVNFKVNNKVPKANIVSKIVPALKYLGKAAAGGAAGYAVIEVGTALYDWFTAAGIPPSLTKAPTPVNNGADAYYWNIPDSLSATGFPRSTYQATMDSYCSSYHQDGYPLPWVARPGGNQSVDYSSGACDYSGNTNINFGYPTYRYSCSSGNYFNKSSNSCQVRPVCSSEQTWDGQACVDSAGVAISDQELKDRLNGQPIPAGKDGNVLAEAVVKALAAEAAAKYDASQTQKDFVPDADPVPQVETPANVSLSPQTTVSPDGTVQEVAKQIQFSPGSTPDTVTATERSTVTNTAPNGAVTVKTVDNAPGDTTPQPATPPKVQCDLYPDTLGCASLEVAVSPDQIPSNPVSIGLTPSSWGSGTCPADVVLNAPFGKTATFSYAPTCQFLSYLSPVLIAIGWITAGWMVIGGVKD